MNPPVAPQTLGDLLGAAMRARVGRPVSTPVRARPRIAASRFEGLTKVGRDLPCIRCEGEAVTVAVHRRGEMDVEQVECEACGLRHRRVNPV